MREELTENLTCMRSYRVFLSILSIIYVGMLLHFSIFMWESRQRYGILFLAMSLMISSMMIARGKGLFGAKGRFQYILAWLFFIASLVGGLYFWVEYYELTCERAGALNNIDVCFSAIYVYLVIQLTWKKVGPTIPVVTLVFLGYGLFGHLLPGHFLKHFPMSFGRLIEVSAGEIEGIFGTLNQLGATWLAIFAFFAGFVQGFGGLDFVLRGSYRLVGKSKRSMPQVSVLSSMGFGGMSGSAGANAVGTGAFTIPTMKRFGLPPAIAAAVESVASSGGQVMPPILGAVAFVMCDYLGKFYYEILLASLFAAILYFGSTMLSVYFIARRYIDPTTNVDLPEELKGKMGLRGLCEGLPIVLALCVLLYVFVVYRVDILLGGFYTTVAFLLARFIYEIVVARGRPRSLWTFTKGLYRGVLIGTEMIVSIALMLASLGIVVRILITTGLAEKISFYMVTTFGGNLWLLLLFTMIVCILFGMAVTTVAAYILAVTLAAPALLKLGIEPLVTHFVVFYWAMLSGITPPVAGVCVITSGIAGSKFLNTCWESMKLGAPKFIMPIIFITQPDILSLSLKGIVPFIISSIGFIALSAGIQSGWGIWQQLLLIVLSVGIFFLSGYYMWICVALVVILFPILWNIYNPKAEGKELAHAVS